MDDAGAVGVRERFACLQKAVGGLAKRERAAGLQARGEVLAVETLHHDERPLFVEAYLEDAHHVGALDPLRRSRLAEEALHAVLVHAPRQEELDGDVALLLLVEGGHHHAHATGADHALHAVAPGHVLAGQYIAFPAGRSPPWGGIRHGHAVEERTRRGGHLSSILARMRAREAPPTFTLLAVR